MAETKNGIKYPDNYDSVADVPQHLKEMAESIEPLIENKVEKEEGKGLSTNDFTNADKEKLDGLNNYDDTEIKEEISDIQEKQKIQNEDIETLKAEKEALEKEVQSLKEDAKLNSLTEDNEGELLHIDNSTGSRFNSLEIEGNEKQETREGYNLFDILNATLQNQDKGVTITKNNDGSITANGTPTSTYIAFVTENKIDNKLEDGETYTLWQENYSSTKYGGIYIQVIANPVAGSSQTVKYIEASNKKITFDVDKTNYTYILKLQISTIENAGTFENYKNRYMLYKGTEDKEFELYGAKPSFDKPSPIECVGDNINIFDDNYYKGFVVTQQNYNSLEKVDLKLEPNKYYVAKIYFEDGTSVAVNNSNFMLYAYKADGTQSVNIPNQVAKAYSNATELVKAKIVANSTGLSTYANKVIAGIKIEEVADEDGQATPYSNYGQGCIQLNIVNKNFLDIEKNATVTKDGVTVTTDENGILTLNGTTTTNIYIKLNGNDIVDNNISTWKQNHYKKGNYLFKVENLSSIQDANMSAFIRKGAIIAENVYATLFSVLNANTKTANLNLKEDVDAVVYLWIASGITLNNVKLKFQIELAESATEIVANEEQNYVIPVQQRMFKQDKFIKINGVWKEMHTMGTVYAKESLLGIGNSLTEENFWRYSINLGNLNRKGGSYIRLLSNYFKYGDSRWKKEEGICGWEAGQILSLGTHNKNYDTAEKLKTFLTENNVEFDYELKEPLYLDCTDEQIAVLDKIEKEAHTYSEVTNVYTEDKVGAIIKTNTNVDLKTVINNVVEAQLEQIGG